MSYIDYSEKLIGIQGVELKEPIKTSENEIEIEFRLKRKACKCPGCNNLTDRIHDYRTQRIKDTPMQGKTVTLIWHKRRYKCPCGKEYYEPNDFITKYQRMSKRKIFQILDKLKTVRTIIELSAPFFYPFLFPRYNFL